MAQKLSARADHVDIGVAESGDGTRGKVVKTESQKVVQVQSQEETKTNVSDWETSTNKYVPACLSQKPRMLGAIRCSVWEQTFSSSVNEFCLQTARLCFMKTYDAIPLKNLVINTRPSHDCQE